MEYAYRHYRRHTGLATMAWIDQRRRMINDANRGMTLSQPSDRTIQNFVAIIPAQSGKPAPDPVVYLGSGPGGIVSTEIAPEIDAGINRDHDLIIMNQRGQFLSIPALTCLPVDEFNRELLSLRFYSPKTKRIHVRATAECRRSEERRVGKECA